MSEAVADEGFVAWLRSDGRVPEAFIRHYQETGKLDGRLWPIRWAVTVTPKRDDSTGADPR